MAYRIYDAEAGALLAPRMLISVREVLADRSVVPDKPGIYAWWFDVGFDGVPAADTLTCGPYRLHYVGIAPKRPSASGKMSRSTLRRRICRNHLGRRLAQSTLRRSLAPLLGLQVVLTPAGKQATSAAGEALLTDWLARHAALSVLVHPEPWLIEEELLRRGDLMLLLNIGGAMHGFRETLMQLRRVVPAGSPTDKSEGTHVTSQDWTCAPTRA